MKKLVFALLLLSLSLGASAQGIAVLNATTFREQGELDKAKEWIDKAVVHEKTSTSAKAWYTRALIYIDLGRKAQEKNSVTNEFKIAYQSYQKVKQLDKPKGEYITELDNQSHNLWANCLNSGLNFAQQGNDSLAYEYYEIVHTLKPAGDTAYAYAYDYAKDLAFKTKNYAKLKYYYEKETATTTKPALFTNLAYIYSEQDNNPEKALQIVQQGRVKFPSDAALVKEEIRLYVLLKRIGEAQTKMEAALAVTPKDTLVLFNLGAIYQQQGDEIKALEFYNKALEINPKYYDALFNIGALYFNKGAKLNDVINKMTMKEYTANGAKKEKERDEILNKGLEYLEKCKAMNPSDENLKAPMKDSYRILKKK